MSSYLEFKTKGDDPENLCRTIDIINNLTLVSFEKEMTLKDISDKILGYLLDKTKHPPKNETEISKTGIKWIVEKDTNFVIIKRDSNFTKKEIQYLCDCFVMMARTTISFIDKKSFSECLNGDELRYLHAVAIARGSGYRKK